MKTPAPDPSKPAGQADPGCAPCLPFCGLGGDATFAQRLLACGLSLLELPQEQQPQPLASPIRP